MMISILLGGFEPFGYVASSSVEPTDPPTKGKLALRGQIPEKLAARSKLATVGSQRHKHTCTTSSGWTGLDESGTVEPLDGTA